MSEDGRVPLKVSVLAEMCNPFAGCCWEELEKAITRAEVRKALDNPLHPNLGAAKTREEHARRIAWFVLNPDLAEPISVDIGIPHMGCFVRWPVQDGNHRFAAAIFRHAPVIIADFGGSWSYGDDLGLFAYG